MNLQIAKTIRALLLPALRQNEFLRFVDQSTTGWDVIRIIPRQEDMRLLIGRGGESIKALKGLASECGRAHNICVALSAEDDPNPLFQKPRQEWSLDLIATALNQLFETLKLTTRCVITAGRANRSNVLCNGPIPDAILPHLERWLPVMAQGRTMLVLNRDNIPAAAPLPSGRPADPAMLDKAREILARQQA